MFDFFEIVFKNVIVLIFSWNEIFDGDVEDFLLEEGIGMNCDSF